jgi:hypothetical protein
MKAEVHFHPAMLEKLRAKLEEMNETDILAKREKHRQLAKYAESLSLEAVLAFLDQLNIESYPLLRLWDCIATEARGRRRVGQPSKSEHKIEARAYALLAAEMLVTGGMPADKADEEIVTRFAEAGIELAPSTLRHWRDDFRGKTDGAKRLRALRKEYGPRGLDGLMHNAKAHWKAAGIVLRELDVLVRLVE